MNVSLNWKGSGWYAYKSATSTTSGNPTRQYIKICDSKSTLKAATALARTQELKGVVHWTHKNQAEARLNVLVQESPR